MTVFNEGPHAVECILSEAPGARSRDSLVIGSDQDFAANSPLVRVGETDTLTAAVAADAGNTGNGTLTMDAQATTSAAKPGVYTVVATEPGTDGGTFDVADPDGKSIGTAKVGVAFAKQIRFTIADGATDFVAGDRFDVTVTAPDGSFTYAAWAPGDDAPDAVALYPAKTGSGETASIAGLTRDAEIKAPLVNWPDAATDAQKRDALAGLANKTGIVAR